MCIDGIMGGMALFTEDLYKKVTRYSTHWVPPESNILARSIGYHRVKNMIGKNIPDDVVQQLIDIKKMYCKKKYKKVVAKATVRKEASKNGEFVQYNKEQEEIRAREIALRAKSNKYVWDNGALRKI